MEWWGLWIPFLGTLLTAIINVILVSIQNIKNRKFEDEVRQKQDNFQREQILRDEQFTLKITLDRHNFEESMTKLKIDADLKAKARLEWISQVRELVAVYMSEISNIVSLIDKINQSYIFNYLDKSIKYTQDEKFENFIKFTDTKLQIVFENHKFKINELSEKILLYFSDKEEHHDIEEIIKEASSQILHLEVIKDFLYIQKPETISDTVSGFNEIRKFLSENIMDIRIIFREYLKQEWDKAKEGK
ncbi:MULTISPECIES: hypothetical protein [Enterococcus]|uniref:Uncharacterized protein n=1 Tax=Enterococcus sulfureus ATCC 49903 TaxID=1140003 RepID=S0NZJ8_9ENTE|nr:hypothetical protein [Enterococcus sulfureus]EOT51330.1 hypothetical protein OMY_00043 [Enterococcus sulfureus ATCC 49903]EOT86987.1 hypothetical protein I573_00042 [Enterococcus sulfureus ATCC 49903]